MKLITRITEEEEQHLRELYRRANETPVIWVGGTADLASQAWSNVARYYEELGKKYGFKPNEVAINTKGEVMELEKCYVCGKVATTALGVIYVRDKNKEGKWDSLPICKHDYYKKYPERAKAEVFDDE